MPPTIAIVNRPLREIASQVGGVEAALAGTVDGELAATRFAAATGASSTPASPEEIAWGFRRLVEAVATDGPVLLVFDDIHWAQPVLLDLIQHKGLWLGGSTALNIVGAMKLARELGPGKTIVTILCDGGSRYQSKLFNPVFLREKKLPLPPWMT